MSHLKDLDLKKWAPKKDCTNASLRRKRTCKRQLSSPHYKLESPAREQRHFLLFVIVPHEIRRMKVACSCEQWWWWWGRLGLPMPASLHITSHNNKQNKTKASFLLPPASSTRHEEKQWTRGERPYAEPTNCRSQRTLQLGERRVLVLAVVIGRAPQIQVTRRQNGKCRQLF